MKKLISKKYAVQLLSSQKAEPVSYNKIDQGKYSFTIKNISNNVEMYFIGEESDMCILSKGMLQNKERKRIAHA